MSTTLPSISTLPSLSASSRAAVLDLLFEPCTQLHTLSVSTLHEKSFASYDELAAAVGAQLIELFESRLKSDQDWLDAILNAHPRLGEKKVESELSRLEQAAMNRGGPGSGEASDPSAAEAAEAEAEELRRLNTQYEATFEGLRYV
jgi:2-oxo-4-hydroxy-4-carboxy--5-ureidoimidazoline (OHCU) decarboxylase